MKLYMLIPIVLLSGCSFFSSGDVNVVSLKKQVNSLKDKNEELTYNNNQLAGALEECRASLINRDNAAASPDVEVPSEPEYEEVELIEVLINNSKVKCAESVYRECGLSLSQCSDGYEYDCLKDVKSKRVTEKRKVEQ